MSTRSALAPLCTALATVGVLVGALLLSAPAGPDDHGSPVLVSGRSFVDRAGRPFTWLADDATGLLGALNRSEVARYLDARAAQGFTVVQTSLDVPMTQYGDAPFADGRPLTTSGADPADDAQYDFWDHLDHVVGEAAARGLAVALRPGRDGYGPARGVVRADGSEFTVLPAGACAAPVPAPARPVVAGAVNEETPSCAGGRTTAADVRGDAWAAVLGGAAGYTYAHPAVREFLGGWTAGGRRRGDWVDALDAPAAGQVRHLSALLGSRPGLSRPDAGPTTTAAAYSGGDDEITLDLGDLAGEVRIWWFDPRTGEAVDLGRAAGGGSITLPVPDPGKDWAIVADAADAALREPGGGGAEDGSGETGDAEPSGDGGRTAPDEPGGRGAGEHGSGEDVGGAGSGAGGASGDAPDDGGAADRSVGDGSTVGGGPDGEPGDEGDDDGSSDGGRAGEDGSDGDGGGALDGLTGADGTDPDAGDSGAAEEPTTGLESESGPESEPEPGSESEPEPGSEPEPEPAPEPEPVTDDGTWDRLAQCESSGDWSIDTGNGYYGGLQFDQATWGDYGGTEFAPRADQATRDQQIEVAVRVRDDRGGYGSWPACASELGLPR